MNIIVTGAAGFIGSHTAKKLLHRGDKVFVIDNFNDYYDPSVKEKNAAELQALGATIARIDITDKQDVRRIFDQVKPDAVVHLAARAGVRPSIEDPSLYVSTNLLGTSHLLEAAVALNVKHFVFASSSSVYGERSTAPFTEKDRVDAPISPYAATKRAGELLGHAFYHIHKLPFSCLRFFTVFRPKGRPDMAPYIFMKAAILGEPIIVFGDGSAMRDFTYVDDIVDGVVRAMDKPREFAIYNLGNHNPVTVSEFIATIEKVSGKQLHKIYEPAKPGDVSKTYASIEHAQKELGWEPKTSLEQGLTNLHRYLIDYLS